MSDTYIGVTRGAQVCLVSPCQMSRGFAMTIVSVLTVGLQVTGVAVCSLCLTWISFTLRFYVRLAILKFVGREDWLTVAAMVGMDDTQLRFSTLILPDCLHYLLFPLSSSYGIWTRRTHGKHYRRIVRNRIQGQIIHISFLLAPYSHILDSIRLRTPLRRSNNRHQSGHSRLLPPPL